PPRPEARAGPEPLLRLEGVTRIYPGGRHGVWGRGQDTTAVDGVSFTLTRGEHVGLVGESGCGKSTLTRAILGLEPLQGGRITLDGAEIDAAKGVPGATRAKMQVVFQDPFGSFNPRHKVGRLVAEPFYLSDPQPSATARREAVADALTAVGLSAEDADRYIHEFSGGQRQRIAIARALVIRPALVILDEAVSALDVQVRAQILDLLSDLSSRYDLATLFISHDLHVVRRITERVLIMRQGQIVEEGATETVFTAPTHAYTRALLAAAPRLPEAG
ncbi:MAG: ATP-binding cassette domain-containing protein, partial [Pseudomonadota bacterium]